LEVGKREQEQEGSLEQREMRRGSGVVLRPHAHDFLESLAKLGIEDGVDDRVEAAVDIAEPCCEEKGRESGAAVHLGEERAEGIHDVAGEEGEPASQEQTCNTTARHFKALLMLMTGTRPGFN